MSPVAFPRPDMCPRKPASRGGSFSAVHQMVRATDFGCCALNPLILYALSPADAFRRFRNSPLGGTDERTTRKPARLRCREPRVSCQRIACREMNRTAGEPGSRHPGSRDRRGGEKASGLDPAVSRGESLSLNSRRDRVTGRASVHRQASAAGVAVKGATRDDDLPSGAGAAPPQPLRECGGPFGKGLAQHRKCAIATPAVGL